MICVNASSITYAAFAMAGILVLALVAVRPESVRQGTANRRFKARNVQYPYAVLSRGKHIDSVRTELTREKAFVEEDLDVPARQAKVEISPVDNLGLRGATDQDENQILDEWVNQSVLVFRVDQVLVAAFRFFSKSLLSKFAKKTVNPEVSRSTANALSPPKLTAFRETS